MAGTQILLQFGKEIARREAVSLLGANGICFAVMTVMFVALGSAADYGNFGRWLLLTLTIICWVFQYCMMAIRHADEWPAGMVFYIIAYIAYVSVRSSEKFFD
jgi:MFS-type transporter involved in bile tolerance (Atg22 family)